MTDKQLRTVLDWINTQRVNQKRKPLKRIPKGDTNHSGSCPIARALNSKYNASVGPYTAQFGDSEGKQHIFELPPIVVKFVNEFDNGKLPQFIKKYK